MRKKILIVNFGGPREKLEVRPFLTELLTDTDVIRTSLPKSLQKMLFRYIAKKRSVKVAEDYDLIGGRSPIYADTEWLAQQLQKRGYEVLTFHRYLPMTHGEFITKANDFICDDTIVFPLFPQFSYATTGSIARWMQNNLCKRTSSMLNWIKSYAEHPAYICAFTAVIKECLKENDLQESETLLFFSPHGLPSSYIFEGDVYKKECERSFNKIMSSFPNAGYVVAYQSQFGRAEWIRPYTSDLAQTIKSWNPGYSNVVFIPLSFTSDHIETLFEVQMQYLPPVKEAGYAAFRCPALNRRNDWVDAIEAIIEQSDLCSTQMLIRADLASCSCRGRVTSN